jgi:hypothetical protein
MSEQEPEALPVILGNDNRPGVGFTTPGRFF